VCVTSETGPNVIKLFYIRNFRIFVISLISLLGKPYHSSLMFVLHSIVGYWDRIHSTSFSSRLTNGSNKLVLHYNGLEMLVRDKHSSLLDPFISKAKNEVL
jgi:hypothetical protein